MLFVKDLIRSKKKFHVGLCIFICEYMHTKNSWILYGPFEWTSVEAYRI